MFKQMTYDPISRMQRLKEFPISKASAEQRKGRAGNLFDLKIYSLKTIKYIFILNYLLAL